MYKNKVFVIKAGGAVFNDEASMRGLIEQVAILHQVGIKTVLVHGGGPQLDQLQATLGIETQMVNGRRVTDQKSIDVTSMVLNGLINTRILAICRALDIEAIGLSGVDSGLVRAHKRGPVPLSAGSAESIDYGFVGDIDSVNVSVIEKLLDIGLMPVVSPLSADANGTLLNINADTVAAAIGGALSAEKLVLCTGAPGILENAQAIENAIRGGVRRVHVISYRSIDGLLAEVFTNEGTGTLVVADLKALSPAEQTAAS
jgi:acetylglutamate kinase